MGASLNTSERLGGMQRYDYSDICLEPLETTLSTKSHLLRMDSILERRFLDAQEDQNRTGWLKPTEMRTKACMKTCNLNERMQLIYKKSKNEQLKDCCLFDRELLSQRPSALLVMLEVISTLGAGFVKNLDDAFGVLPDCQPSRGFSNFNVWRYFAGSTSCSAEKRSQVGGSGW